MLADGQEMLALSHGLALPLAAEREAGGCLGKIQHWTAIICVPVDGKCAALPGLPPKVTRTSQDRWEHLVVSYWELKQSKIPSSDKGLEEESLEAAASGVASL